MCVGLKYTLQVQRTINSVQNPFCSSFKHLIGLDVHVIRTLGAVHMSRAELNHENLYFSTT